MNLPRFFFIALVALTASVAQANQTANRYVVAQSLQGFKLTGNEACDGLSTMDSHFPMQVVDVNALTLCREVIATLLADGFVRPIDERAKDHLVSMANLWIWDSLLDYWTSQIDYQDNTTNVFVAAQNLFQAANYLKQGGGDLSTVIKVRILWLTMHVLGQRGVDEQAYNNAYQQLTKIHQMLAIDRESLSGKQRKSLSAYSAFWLGMVSHKAAIFDSTANQSAGYQLLRQAYEESPEAKTGLAYLLGLYFEFIYSHASEEVAEQYSLAQLFDHIEVAAQNAGNDEVLIWNLIQQGQSELYKVRSVHDVSYNKVINILDRVERLSEQKSYRHYQVDAANLRIGLFIKFDQHAQAAAIVDSQMPVMTYLQTLAEQGSPDLALWAGRYLQLIDLIGRHLVVSGDAAQAKDLFSRLPADVFPSAALNLSALYIRDGQFQKALDVLAEVDASRQPQISSIYRRNLSLARHLSGDINGAIEGLGNSSNPSEVDIAYKTALYAYNQQTDAALDLIKQHTGTGYGLLAQSLMKTMLAIYRDPPQNKQPGNIINTPTPLFSFISSPLWLTSDFEKNGMPYYQGANLVAQQNQASLVTGLKGDSLFGSAQLSANGDFTALSTANIITLWDNKTGLPFRRLTEAYNVTDMLFVNDDSQLLVGINNALNLWDLNTGEIIYSLPTNDYHKFRIVYNKHKNTVFYQNPYGKVVEVNVADPSDSTEIEAAAGGGFLTLDEQASRLFYVRSVYDQNNNLLSNLVSYDLKNKTVTDDVALLSGQINDLWFARHSQQLLLSRDMSQPGDYSSPPQFQLALLATTNGLKEDTFFDFGSRIELRGEVGDGSQLLFRVYDHEVILDLNKNKVKPATVETEKRIYRLSADRRTALVADQADRSLYITQYPTLKTVSQLKQLQSDAGLAFYDEDKQRLMVSSGYNRLHLWDMSSGQEIHRKQQHPSFKPAYINGQLLAVVDELENYPRENNQWGVFESGEWVTKPLAVPPEILDSEIRDDLQVFETPSYLYFTSWDEYPTKARRVWRTAHDFSHPQLLPWILQDENIVGIAQSQQLLITSTDSKIILRDLQSQVIKHEIQEQDEYGNSKDLRVVWIDQEQALIWLELDQQLKAYDFTGAEKFSFIDEVGKLSQISGSKRQASLIATYEIAGSTLIRKINRLTGKVVGSDLLFDRSAEKINHSTNGNYLLISTAQGSIDFWSLKANKILFSMYLLPDDNWVVIDPKGRFDTNNPGELGFLAWRLPEQPMTAYPVDIFLRNFYEPRLIPRLLNNAVFADIPDLNTINRWQVQLVFGDVVQTSTGKLDITVDLVKGDWPSADQARAYDLRLFRGGQQVAVYPKDHGEVVLKNGKRSVTFRDVALPNMQPGEQLELSAMAFNSDGVKSRTASYHYSQNSATPANPARAYLLNIGMNHYTDENWDLAFAGNDAKLLAESLAQTLQQSGRYEAVQQQQLITAKTQLIDKTAVKNALLSLTEGDGTGALSRSTPNDTIIMTWSGHGYVDEHGEFYLLTSQVGNNSGDMQQVLNGAVSATELSRWVEAIDAQRFILVIDACYSAAAVGADEFKPGPMGNKGFGQLAWYKGMQILTASQANDVALESDLLQHGLLTYALVKDGLNAQQADYLPKDGIVTAREWLTYAQQRVPQVYRALKSGNGSELTASRGIKRVQMPEVEQLQLPALFDFYRGEQVLTMPVEQGAR